jgi:hypothetical protein
LAILHQRVSTASGKPIGATSLAGSGVPERLNRSNDIAGELHQCLADAQAYYEISFVPSSDQAREPYHRNEVRTDKPGLTARTLQGYYPQQTAP